MKFALAIHGGAGTITKNLLTPELEKKYHAALRYALDAGKYYLLQGASALEVVQHTVQILEDEPLFNAGRGSVYNAVGDHEMDASIMCGKTLNAGAVAAVKFVKNPVALAKSILDDGQYVLLCGDGALEFAKSKGLEIRDANYFYTSHRYEQWQKIKKRHAVALDHTDEKKFGTVGAVAMDVDGNLASATSTGGLVNKQFGRLGDTCVIGAGTYANNQTCAVSCTGYGEYFIRSVVAHDVHAQMLYNQMDLATSCTRVVQSKLKDIGGEGGLIAVDRDGNIQMEFNSEGMYRGMISHIHTEGKTLIYR